MNYKKRTISMVMVLFCLIFTLFAQSVSLKMSNITVKEAMSELKQKSGYSFVFAAGDVNTKKVVSVQAKQLDDAIKQILDGQNLMYEVKGKNIILMKKPAQTPGSAKPERKVSGIVTDASGEPIIGANVVVKGDEAHGVITDLNGHFALAVPEEGAFEVSYIGYTAQQVPLKGKSSFSVKLQEDSKLLDEVVVVGYTSQKKGLLTGSVVSMNMTESVEKMATASASNVLVGKLAGVNVGTANGIPGENPSLSIRTKSSNSKQDVLFVIDGIVRGGGDFNNLAPNEIENITVLKDAASAAVYGARSDGGVVLVTTKRGKVGKPIFNYSYSFGIDTRTANVDMTDGIQTGEIFNRVHAGEAENWFWTDEEFDYLRTINGGWGYNQLDAVWRDPTIQTHNLSVNGGSEKVKYFAGVSYVQQKGFLEPLNYNKFNFRLNATVDVTDNLQFFASMAMSDRQKENATFEGGGSLYTKLLKWQPDQPVYTDDGQFIDYGWIGSVAGEVEGKGGYSKERNLKPQLNLQATYKIPGVDGLSVKAGYGSNWANDRNEDFRTKYKMAVMKKEGQYNHIVRTDPGSIASYRESSQISKDYIKKKSSWGQDYQLNFQVNYNRTFKEVHAVQAAFVYEFSESSGGGVYGERRGFPIYLTDQFWAASDASKDQDGGGDTTWENGRSSFVGQLNYTYNNKYLFNLSFREDGSMKFAKDQRWGFFPAGSVGWIISEENFFNKNKVDFLKVRASAGLTGNDAVGGWAWQESYKGGNSTYFGKDPSKQMGVKYGSIANTALTWEKSLSYNIGVDVNFLKHWNATFEYWYKNTFDILGKREKSVPSSFSLAMPEDNYAEIHAQGFDFNVGYKNTWGDFDFYGNLNLSYGWNNIVIEDYAQNAKWYNVPIGKATSRQTGYRFDQIIRNQEELDRFNAEHPDYTFNGLKPDLGMMTYKDLSGPDGTPDGIIDSWDKDILVAKDFPIYYGLNLGGNWKGWSVDMLFNGKLKYQKSFRNLADGVEHNRMWSEWYNDSWTPETPNGWLPERRSRDITYKEDSDFWLKDASFIRLKYINVGYTLPKLWYKGVFDRVKLYASGNNLFVLSSFDYYDPEIGGGFDYPVMRSFNFGIDITF